MNRRGFLTGLVAAPAVLRLGLYMPVKKILPVRFEITTPTVEEAILHAMQRARIMTLERSIPEKRWELHCKLIEKWLDDA